MHYSTLDPHEGQLIAFYLKHVGQKGQIKAAFVHAHLLPINVDSKNLLDLPLLSSVDDCDASTFGREDMLELQCELQLLQKEHSEEAEELQTAINLVGECFASPNTCMCVTPFI